MTGRKSTDGSERAGNFYYRFVVILYVTYQPLLRTGNSNLWSTDTGFFIHLIRNMNFLLMSLSTIIHCSSKHLGRNLVAFPTLGFALPSLILRISCVCISFRHAVFHDYGNSTVRLGQSRFSSGCLIYSSEKHFYFRRYCTLPFKSQLSTNFSATYSSFV